MAIANDASITQSAVNSSSSSKALNHAANVLVLISVASNSVLVSSITVGSVSATKLSAPTASSPHHELWYAWVAAAGNDTVTVNMASACDHDWTAASLTGTVTSSFFECTNSATGSSTAASVVVNAGTTGRRIIEAVAMWNGNASHTMTPASGQTEINQIIMLSTVYLGDEVNYRDDSAQRTMTVNFSSLGNWVAIGTAILPQTAVNVNVSDSGAGVESSVSPILPMAETGAGVDALTSKDFGTLDSGLAVDAVLRNFTIVGIVKDASGTPIAGADGLAFQNE